MLRDLIQLRVLGTAIGLLAIALAVTPFLGRGRTGDSTDGTTPADDGGVVNRTAFYAPSEGAGDGASSAEESTSKPQLADLVVEKKRLNLEIATYRLKGDKAKSLQELLEKHIGRPDLLEIRIESPETLSIIASPRTHEAVEKWVALLRVAAEAKEDKPIAAERTTNATR